MSDLSLPHFPLGQSVPYPNSYSPDQLFPLSRSNNRSGLNLTEPLPFSGVDIWTAYELSWLELETKKPRIALAEFYIPCDSPNLIESKSLKLYLNSLNQATFMNETELKSVIQNDLSAAAGAKIRVNLFLPPFKMVQPPQEFAGVNIDDLPVTIDCFTPEPNFLIADHELIVSETVNSNLLKSNCPATGQPDWASILISYQGPKINHAGLLQYIISFRQHQDFGEHCVETIFMDLLHRCQPEKLTVYARYSRRGGLDINPFRSNFQSLTQNLRNFRQ